LLSPLSDEFTEVTEAMLKKLAYRMTAVTDSREAWDVLS
jgi:CheY-like chemotaxis protein